MIEGGVPAIVPEDLFNRVQERMEKNRHAPAMAKAKEDYLLTTKLFCGKCERMMVGESGKSHTGAMHYYYKCSGAKRLKDCDKKAVRKDWIERVVVRLTMQRVMDEEKINRLIDAILVMQEQEDTTTPALRSQLAETESSIGNILKAIEQGIFTPSTKQRLDELEARKEEILANIQTAELQKPKLTREQMTAWFEQFRHGDPANREFQKRLIDTFVNAVYVFDDKLVLTYNYQHGTQTISLEEIESALSSDFDGATPPRRSKRYIACSDFSHTKVRTRSDRCSSFPNRTHFVGLRFVLETLFAGGIYHISMLHGSRLAIVAGLLFLFLNWKCSGLLISLIFAFRCQSGLQCGRSLFFYRMLLRFLYHVSASFLRQNPHR